MSIGLIERITGRRAAAEAKRLDTYRELVLAVADGDDVDPARGDAILLDAAQTPDQLAADVASLKQRRLDAELAATLADLQTKRETLCKSLTSIRDALREAEQRHREQTAGTYRQLNAVDAEIRTAQEAAIRLRAGRPDPREPELRRERANRTQRRDELLNLLGNPAQGLRGRLKALQFALDHPTEPPRDELLHFKYAADPELLRNGITVTQNEIRGLEAELAPIDARLAEINATLAEIERNQLVP